MACTTSQKAKHNSTGLLNLAKFVANLCRKLSFAVLQNGIDTEISLKLCALLALEVCAKGAQHHNKLKTPLQACKHFAKFVANLCRKVEFKWG